MIRPCTDADFDTIFTIINDAAQAYCGLIPTDCWHVPYMPREYLPFIEETAAFNNGICAKRNGGTRCARPHTRQVKERSVLSSEQMSTEGNTNSR
jgi:hypothetical protein